MSFWNDGTMDVPTGVLESDDPFYDAYYAPNAEKDCPRCGTVNMVHVTHLQTPLGVRPVWQAVCGKCHRDFSDADSAPRNEFRPAGEPDGNRINGEQSERRAGHGNAGNVETHVAEPCAA